MTHTTYGQLAGDMLQSFNYEMNHGSGGYSNFSSSSSSSLVDQGTWNSFYSDYRSY
jgi:hypothetical protein